MAKMFIQTVETRKPEDKIHWVIDCGDIDDDIEGYAPNATKAREEADVYASFCPFACVYIEDTETGEVIDHYWN